jgi:hypothetical protein
MSDKIHPGVKHAAFVGLRAFHGFKTAHGPAKLAARLPVVGPALGLVVLVGGTVAGAVGGFNDYDG